MHIIHSLEKKIWEQYKGNEFYGQDSVDKCGFIHCSEVSTYKFVAPNFKEEKEERVLLVIDTDKVKPEIKWEDLYNCGVEYPHIYGLLNLDAVVSVLPHLWSEEKVWVVNKELC